MPVAGSLSSSHLEQAPVLPIYGVPIQTGLAAGNAYCLRAVSAEYTANDSGPTLNDRCSLGASFCVRFGSESVGNAHRKQPD